jgi:hypothetical protein
MWPLNFFSEEASVLLDAFYEDKRRRTTIDKNSEWMLQEFQNFIKVFTVPERSEIHTQIGYDS